MVAFSGIFVSKLKLRKERLSLWYLHKTKFVTEKNNFLGIYAHDMSCLDVK